MMRRSAFFPWPSENSKVYDVIAAMPLIAWYGFSVSRMVPGVVQKLDRADFNNIDLTFVFSLLAQLAGVLFFVLLLTFLILRTPARSKARGLAPRITALGGTYLGAAVVSLPVQPMDLEFSLLSLGFILGGLAFSAFSLLHLGRSFSLMAEARRLVTDGPYGLIRHPLYLGEAIAMFGVTLQYRSPLAFTFMAIQFAFQFQRMKNEEQVLASQFPDYETYRLRTARIIPGVY